MKEQQPTCELCGEPMPAGEEMFTYHGYSGGCPKRAAPMELYQQRVVDEKNELDARYEKLLDFLRTDVFEGLPQPEKDRLVRQADIMLKYSLVLGERIAASSEK